MENSNIKVIENLKDFLVSIKEEASKNEKIFIFWDINETIITSNVGINSKINKSYKIMKKIGKGYRMRTERNIFNFFKKRYNSKPLGIIN